MYVCECMYVCLYIYMYVCVCMYVYICIYVCVCMFATASLIKCFDGVVKCAMKVYFGIIFEVSYRGLKHCVCVCV